MNALDSLKTAVVSVFFSAALLGAAATGTAQDESVTPVPVAAPDERTVATVQSVQDDLKLAQLQSEATEEALTELALSDVRDLEQAYLIFSTWVARMEETGERLVVHADQMRYLGPSYLVESGQTPTACAFPRLRVPLDSREAQLGAYFDAVAEETWKVKRAYRAFQFDISEIDAVLDNELNLRIIDSLGSMLRKAQVDADSLQEALARAQAVLERAKVASQAAGAVPS